MAIIPVSSVAERMKKLAARGGSDDDDIADDSPTELALSAAEDLIQAVSHKDAAGVVDALKRCMDECSPSDDTPQTQE